MNNRLYCTFIEPNEIEEISDKIQSSYKVLFNKIFKNPFRKLRGFFYFSILKDSNDFLRLSQAKWAPSICGEYWAEQK